MTSPKPTLENEIKEASIHHCLLVYGCEGQDKGLVNKSFIKGANFGALEMYKLIYSILRNNCML